MTKLGATLCWNTAGLSLVDIRRSDLTSRDKEGGDIV